jgi:hypothetical protein
MSDHEFHLLCWHFGPYGPQDVHMHPCIEHEHCPTALQGVGNKCGGSGLHRRVRYDSRKKEWANA